MELYYSSVNVSVIFERTLKKQFDASGIHKKNGKLRVQEMMKEPNKSREDTIITEALKNLNALKTILYPTDTVWGIGGDATQAEVVKKIIALKKRAASKSLICLVNSLEMLQEYVPKIPEEALPYLKSEHPTTIIYENPQRLASNLVAPDATVAIRIPKHAFLQKLIGQFGKPLISTSANISGTATPSCFQDIAPQILEGVDYVVPLEQDIKNKAASRIVKINSSGTVQVLRS